MFNEKDILTRLQNGESAEAIAKEMTDALNKANEVYEKEIVSKKKDKEKLDKMQSILDQMHDFFIDFYCSSNDDIDAINDAFKELNAEEAITLIEEVSSIMDNLSGLQLKLFGSNVPDVKKKNGASKSINVDQTIDSFLKSLNLK